MACSGDWGSEILDFVGYPQRRTNSIQLPRCDTVVAIRDKSHGPGGRSDGPNSGLGCGCGCCHTRELGNAFYCVPRQTG